MAMKDADAAAAADADDDVDGDADADAPDNEGDDGLPTAFLLTSGCNRCFLTQSHSAHASQ